MGISTPPWKRRTSPRKNAGFERYGEPGHECLDLRHELQGHHRGDQRVGGAIGKGRSVVDEKLHLVAVGGARPRDHRGRDVHAGDTKTALVEGVSEAAGAAPEVERPASGQWGLRGVEAPEDRRPGDEDVVGRTRGDLLLVPGRIEVVAERVPGMAGIRTRCRCAQSGATPYEETAAGTRAGRGTPKAD
ncbi:MAG: hypothetical protein QOF33_4472 [Thermomicrobiales bacterium]|nr:hypothetical protein [Thermomicrobiales bacterium]